MCRPCFSPSECRRLCDSTVTSRFRADFHADQAHVIRKLAAFRGIPNLGDQFVEQRSGRQARSLPHLFHDPIQFEFILGSTRHILQPVGEEHDQIARSDLHFHRRESRTFEKTESGAGPPTRTLQEFHLVGRAMDQ